MHIYIGKTSILHKDILSDYIEIIFYKNHKEICVDIFPLDIHGMFYH